MELFTINFNADKLLYIQLYEYIVERIKQGDFKPNDKLPSKRKLSNHLCISLNTIQTTYDLLITEGYIESIPKKGFYILKYTKPKSTPNYNNFNEEKIRKYKYNLTTSSTDGNIFPSLLWARLTKEVLLEDKYYQIGPSQGNYELRYEISNFISQSRGVVTKPENIIISTGIEYLLPIINVLVEGEMGIENPGYKKIGDILKNNKIKYSYLDINTYDISKSISSIYITPSHQFPTGKIMSIQKRLELINWAFDNDKYIIEDDYDSEYRFEGAIIPSLQSLNNNRVFYISTFSRTISPSIRIAYMVVPTPMLDKYHNLYKRYSNPVSNELQLVLSKFIKSGSYERHLRKARTLYKKKKDLIINELKSSSIKDYIKIESYNIGLSILVKIDKEINEAILLNNLSLQNMKISFLSDFYYTNNHSHALIIGIAQIDYNLIKKAIAILAKEIKDLIEV